MVMRRGHGSRGRPLLLERTNGACAEVVEHPDPEDRHRENSRKWTPRSRSSPQCSVRLSSSAPSPPGWCFTWTGASTRPGPTRTGASTKPRPTWTGASTRPRPIRTGVSTRPTSASTRPGPTPGRASNGCVKTIFAWRGSSMRRRARSPICARTSAGCRGIVERTYRPVTLHRPAGSGGEGRGRGPRYAGELRHGSRR